jgi:hypothetical protein
VKRSRLRGIVRSTCRSSIELFGRGTSAPWHSQSLYEDRVGVVPENPNANEINLSTCGARAHATIPVASLFGDVRVRVSAKNR